MGAVQRPLLRGSKSKDTRVSRTARAMGRQSPHDDACVSRAARALAFDPRATMPAYHAQPARQTLAVMSPNRVNSQRAQWAADPRAQLSGVPQKPTLQPTWSAHQYTTSWT